MVIEINKIIEIKKTYRSFSRKEFEDFFSDLGKSKSPGCYIGEGWEVSLEEEHIEYIGSIGLVTVTLYLKLSPEIKDEFITHMRKSFLRGGA